MKVVWVVRPAEGGLLQHVQQLSEGMSEFEIVVVAPPSWSAGAVSIGSYRSRSPMGCGPAKI